MRQAAYTGDVSCDDIITAEREADLLRAEGLDVCVLPVSAYSTLGWLDDPVSYHREPPPLEISGIDERRSALTPYRHLRYESGYQPHPALEADRWLGFEKNRDGYAYVLEHEDGSDRPWIVLSGGTGRFANSIIVGMTILDGIL